jgi:hypothetical protein
MAKRAFSAVVTFEYPQAAPETVRTVIEAGNERKATSLALREARRAFPRRQPASIVVLLELKAAS